MNPVKHCTNPRHRHFFVYSTRPPPLLVTPLANFFSPLTKPNQRTHIVDHSTTCRRTLFFFSTYPYYAVVCILSEKHCRGGRARVLLLTLRRRRRAAARKITRVIISRRPHPVRNNTIAYYYNTVRSRNNKYKQIRVMYRGRVQIKRGPCVVLI